MVTKAPQRGRWKAIIIALSCFALAFGAISCGGGGGGSSAPVVTSPNFSQSTTTVNFGSALVNTTIPYSGTPSFATVTNGGNAALSITSIQIMGANANDFALAAPPSSMTECPTGQGSLAAGASCGITATFTPSAPGARTATVVFTDNATGSPQSITLTGTGTAPQGTLSTSSLTFGAQTIGTPSAAQTVTLTDLNSTNPASLNISAIGVSGNNAADFTPLGGTCTGPGTVAVGGSCTIVVTFTPASSSVTSRSATLTITDNTNGVNGTQQQVALSGTANFPTISLAPAPASGTISLTSNVGASSSPATITVSDIGTAPLTLNSISVNPATFSLSSGTNACPSTGGTVPTGGSCTIYVTFTPTAAGTVPGSLMISDNDPSTPSPAFTLSGAGVGGVSLSPASTSFGSQTLNLASAAATIIVSNTLSGSVSIGAINLAGSNPANFTATAGGSCSSVAANGTCPISVTFTPNATGSFSATLSANYSGAASGTTQAVMLTGSGTTSNLAVNPLSLTFPAQGLATSTTMYVTLTNTSTATSLTSGSNTVTGQTNSNFSYNSSAGSPACGASISPSSSCQVAIVFDPTLPGNQTATLNISYSLSGTSQSATIPLSGTGNGPVVNLSPQSLTFTTTLGQTSSIQPITVTNQGNIGLTFNSGYPQLTGTNSADFSLAGSTCSAAITVAAGGSCTLNVTFTPTIAGSESASVNLVDNSTPSSQSVGLTGTGTGPVVSFNGTTSLTFSAVSVGATTGSNQTISVSNKGNAALTISGTPITGTNASYFNVTANTCGSSVAAGTTCTITLTFLPTAPGNNLTASFTLTDNASTTPSVSLTGTGNGPLAALSTTPLSFANQAVNTTSASQAATLSNNGNTALTIGSTPIGFTGTNPSDFTQTNNCGTSLAAGSSCTINVTFAPVATGSLSALLTVTDNSNNGTNIQQTLAVSGTGTGAVASFSPAGPYTFASQDQGTTSSAQPITLTNTGTGANLVITGITLTGTNPSNFALMTSGTNVCTYGAQTLTPGSSCVIYVTFTPASTTSYSASISVADNLTGSPQLYGLAGTGTQGINFAYTSLNMGSVNVGQTGSSSLVITVSNNGSANFTISSISSSDTTDFSQTNTCTNVTLTPNGTTCTITVKFTPQSPGSLSTTLSVNDTLTGSPQTLTVSGTGVGPNPTLSGNLTFSTGQNVGTTSSAQSVMLTNSSPANASLTITGVNSPTGADPGDFAVTTGTNSCTTVGTLITGSSCNVWVTFTPQAIGTRTASIGVADSAITSPQSFNVTGTGLGANVVTTPAFSPTTPPTISFPAESLGSPATQPITLNNTGNAALTISSIAITGATADFSQTNTCGTSLAANGSCTITVTFQPVTPGSLSGTLTIADNGVNSTSQTFSLSGTGNGPSPTLSASSLSFGTLTFGTSLTLMPTLSNPSPANQALTIASTNGLAISGANAGDFALTSGSSQCTNGGSVPAPTSTTSSCTIYVKFTPTLTTQENATLTITDNGDPTTQTITMTGSGTGSLVSVSPSSFNFTPSPSPGQMVNTTSSTIATITLSNTGNQSLTITGISLAGTNPGDFGLTSGTSQCTYSGESLPAGSSCFIYATFTPTATGTRSAAVNIADTPTNGNSPQTVSLSGMGISPNFVFSPQSPPSFGNQAVGQASSTQTIELENTGSASATYSNITMGGSNPSSFVLTTGTGAVPECSYSSGGTITAGSGCDVFVYFDPTTSGSLSASLLGSGTSASANLAGTGGGPQIQFTNSSGAQISGLTFGALSCPATSTTYCPTTLQILSGSPTLPYSLPGQPFFTTSDPQTITVTNVGTQILNIASIAINSSLSTTPNDFVVNNGCGTTLAANTSCTITVNYAPITVPNTSLSSVATLTFTDNNLGTTGSTQNLTFTGAASHDIVLSWNASTTYGVSSYNVFAGSATGQESTTPIYCIVTTKSTASSLSCADPNPGLSTTAPTWYTVSAVANGVQSPVASPDVSATSLGP